MDSTQLVQSILPGIMPEKFPCTILTHQETPSWHGPRYTESVESVSTNTLHSDEEEEETKHTAHTTTTTTKNLSLDPQEVIAPRPQPPRSQHSTAQSRRPSCALTHLNMPLLLSPAKSESLDFTNQVDIEDQRRTFEPDSGMSMLFAKRPVKKFTGTCVSALTRALMAAEEVEGPPEFMGTAERDLVARRRKIKMQRRYSMGDRRQSAAQDKSMTSVAALPRWKSMECLTGAAFMASCEEDVRVW